MTLKVEQSSGGSSGIFGYQTSPRYNMNDNDFYYRIPSSRDKEKNGYWIPHSTATAPGVDDEDSFIHHHQGSIDYNQDPTAIIGQLRNTQHSNNNSGLTRLRRHYHTASPSSPHSPSHTNHYSQQNPGGFHLEESNGSIISPGPTNGRNAGKMSDYNGIGNGTTTTTLIRNSPGRIEYDNRNVMMTMPQHYYQHTLVKPSTSVKTPVTNYYQSSSSPPSSHHHHQHPNSLIWSASTKGSRPTVVLRKPRSRRLLRSLLCCFGAKPVTNNAAAGGRGDGGGGPNGNNNNNKNGASLTDSNHQHQLPAGQQGPYSPKPSEKLLLPPVRPCDINKKCLIIDLDETLVHSSFKPVKNPDFVIPVEIDGVIHQVYVLKRPYVDDFLERIGQFFECILFTASLAKYADPVADLLDKGGVFRSRLFREACVFHKGNYVKDLNRLGRDLKRVVIVDNSPASYAFHPDNAIPVQSWFDDTSDTELLDLLPILERLAQVDNIYSVLTASNHLIPNSI